MLLGIRHLYYMRPLETHQGSRGRVSIDKIDDASVKPWKFIVVIQESVSLAINPSGRVALTESLALQPARSQDGAISRQEPTGFPSVCLKTLLIRVGGKLMAHLLTWRNGISEDCRTRCKRRGGTVVSYQAPAMDQHVSYQLSTPKYDANLIRHICDSVPLLRLISAARAVCQDVKG